MHTHLHPTWFCFYAMIIVKQYVCVRVRECVCVYVTVCVYFFNFVCAVAVDAGTQACVEAAC